MRDMSVGVICVCLQLILLHTYVFQAVNAKLQLSVVSCMSEHIHVGSEELSLNGSVCILVNGVCSISLF